MTAKLDTDQQRWLLMEAHNRVVRSVAKVRRAQMASSRARARLAVHRVEAWSAAAYVNEAQADLVRLGVRPT